MIINPATTSWCRPDNLVSCPPYHTSPSGEIIHRNETSRFPYSAYHLYCSPGNAEHLERPYDICDPYSNPQAQELIQILPHPEWSVHGYPEKQGDGWIGDSRTWELDVGALSSRLYFYQVSKIFNILCTTSSLRLGLVLKLFVFDDRTREPNQQNASGHRSMLVLKSMLAIDKKLQSGQ